MATTKTSYEAIPDRHMQAIRNYIEHRLEPGGFIRAVLRNDLLNALGYADEESRDALQPIVLWLYNNAPSNCWGSRKIVDRWLSREEMAA